MSKLFALKSGDIFKLSGTRFEFRSVKNKFMPTLGIVPNAICRNLDEDKVSLFTKNFEVELISPPTRRGE